MCIGIPMQVLRTEPGHAVCAGGGEERRVRTALTGDLVPGEWVLVFLDSAQERISADRAAEVEATLALLVAAQAGLAPDAPVAFALPSQMTPEQLQALSGRPLENA